MNENTQGPSVIKVAIIIGIQIAIALIHVFRLGQVFSGRLYQVYYGYFSDFILPFGMYFLLSLNDQIIFLRKWFVKFLLIFGGATVAEILQAFGIYALGVTFDPLDIVMYASGALAAAGIEKLLFERIISSWNGGRALLH